MPKRQAFRRIGQLDLAEAEIRSGHTINLELDPCLVTGAVLVAGLGGTDSYRWIFFGFNKEFAGLIRVNSKVRASTLVTPGRVIKIPIDSVIAEQ